MNLIKKHLSLSPIYQGGLTNHLPMMIIALEQLNVKGPIIEDISDQYLEEKSIPDLSDKFYPHSEFEEAYISKTNLYFDQIKDQGKDEVIKEFFSVAKFSLGSALFHGIIRLYYSILKKDNLLIAQALAYFELSATQYIIEGKIQTGIDSFSKLEEVRTSTEFHFSSKSTMSKLNEMIEMKEVMDNLFTLENITSREDEVLELILTQYLKTHDFYILHVITGFHALFSLQKYFSDYEQVLTQFFLLAQLFMMFNDYKEIIEPPKESNPEKLRNRILELTDAHDIKLLYTITKLLEQFPNNKLKQIVTIIFT